MVNYRDFFKDGYKYKWDKDVYHYLDNIASQNIDEKGGEFVTGQSERWFQSGISKQKMNFVMLSTKYFQH